MTIAAKLHDDEEFAITSVERKFGGTWRVGENPPDAYLKIGAREIAVEISTLMQHVTDDRGTRPRLSDDRPAIDLANELDAELHGLIPDGQTVGLVLSSPIRKFRQTKTALAKQLRERLPDGKSFTAETVIEINGNVIKIQRHYDHRDNKKMWGVITNSSSSPNIMENARNILEERIAVKTKKCAGIVGNNPLWLVLINDYFLADASNYKNVLSSFSPVHPFEKVVLVNTDGTAEQIYP